MVSTRELRADYKIGPPGWQSQNRRAGVGEKTGQFKGLSGEKLWAGKAAAAFPPRAANFALYSGFGILNSG
jgi:hypothetical protein